MRDKIALYLTKFMYVTMIIIPFVASFSSAAVTIVSVLMINAFIVKRIALKDFHFTRLPIRTPFLLIVCFSLISFIKTSSLMASMQGIWKLFYYGSLFTIITEEIKDKRHLQSVIIAIILGLFLASLDGIWQLYSGWDFFRHHPYSIQEGLGLLRIRAAFPHTNIFAVYLILFLPLALIMFIDNWDKYLKRIFYLAVFLLASFCLIFTFARGAAAGFIISVAFMGIMRKNKSMIVFLICLMILAPLVMPAGIKYWAKGTQSIWDILLNPERVGDFRNALNMIRHNPILGVGVNTYSLNIDKYKIKDDSRYIGNAGYAHNIYLQMFAEIGLFGLVSFLLLIFSLFGYGLNKYNTLGDPVLKIVALAMMAGIIAFLINGLTETVLYYSKVVVLFWYEIGILLAVIKVSEKKSGDNLA